MTITATTVTTATTTKKPTVIKGICARAVNFGQKKQERATLALFASGALVVASLQLVLILFLHLNSSLIAISARLDEAARACQAQVPAENVIRVSPEMATLGDDDQYDDQYDDDNDNVQGMKKLEFDVLSTGSKSRTAYIDAQRSTWASHSNVRLFFGSYELEETVVVGKGDGDSSGLMLLHQNYNRTAPHEDVTVVEYRHDDENTCLAQHTVRQIRQRGVYCRTSQPQDSIIMKFWRRESPFGPSMEKKGRNSIPGWYCAQQRPGISIGRLGQLYRSMMEERAKETRRVAKLYDETLFDRASSRNRINGAKGKRELDDLPDYLLVVDDDTYINVELMGQHLVKKQLERQQRIKREADDSGKEEEEEVPIVYAGCTFVRRHSFPFGGYGLIFNHEAVRRLIRPVHCPDINNNTITTATPSDAANRNGSLDSHFDISKETQHDPNLSFDEMVCAQIQHDLIGERPLFRNGMSVSDLMAAISTSDNFCMHSDWVTGYFIKFYSLSLPVHPPLDPVVARKDPFTRLHMYDNIRFPYCVKKYDGASCDAETAHLCHSQSPERMTNLTNVWRNKLGPNAFR